MKQLLIMHHFNGVWRVVSDIGARARAISCQTRQQNKRLTRIAKYALFSDL